VPAGIGVQGSQLEKQHNICISAEWSFDNAVVKLGIVGLILWVEMGLSSPISPWKVGKKVKATPWFPLASGTILRKRYAVVNYDKLTYAGNHQSTNAEAR
jgi:hypothetical protein